jgi:anti-sigma factor RsiW
MNEPRAACAAYEEELSAFVDDELAPDRRAEVEAHLDACPGCRRRLEALCDVDLALASAPLPPVSRELARRVSERVAARPDAATAREPHGARARRRPLWRPAALAAAACALLALYLGLRPADAPPPARPDAAPGVAAALEELPDEELALLLDLETLEDLGVIANLDLLEQIVELEAAG